MVAVIREHVVLSAGPYFRHFLQYFDEFRRFHCGLAKKNFPVEMVLSTLRLNQNDSTLVGISRNDTVTVLLVTGCIGEKCT